MKKFTFRLQAVLRVRKIEEDLAKNELIRANNVASQAAQHLEERRVTYETAVNENPVANGAPRASRMALEDVLVARNRLELCGQRLIAAEVKLGEAKQLVSESALNYASAAAKTKAITKLRERAFDEFTIESLRAEQNELDDLASARRLAVAGGHT